MPSEVIQEEKNDPEDHERRTNRWRTLCGRVTSEPATFVYCFAIGIYAAIIPNFLLQKVCSPLVEPPLDHFCNETDLVVNAADIMTTRNTIREFMPVLVLLVAGSWRDSTGLNKPLMYSALFGELLGVSVELFAAYRWSVSPWLTSIADSVLYGISGGSKLFYVGATCAITDQTSPEERTTRLAIYQVAAYTGSCLSSGVSGYCLDVLGYKWFFIFIIGLYLLTILLVMIMKQDVTRPKEQRRVGVLQKMKAMWKPRPNNSVVWLMLWGCILINVSAGAESNLYLYYLKQGFDFTVRESGLYLAFRLMFGVVCTMILSPVFTKILKWSDFKVGIISSTMTLISTVLMVFARTVLELMLCAVLDFLKIFVYTLPMSVVSKCVDKDEIGVFVSLRFIGGCIVPIGMYYIYDYIFSITTDTLPGAFFFASGAITLLVLLSFCISPCIYKAPEAETSHDNLATGDAEKCESSPPERTIFMKKSTE